MPASPAATLRRLGTYRVGDALVDLFASQGRYSGLVRACGHSWRFELRGPLGLVHDAAQLALMACAKGGYYDSLNRDFALPPWVPEPHVADAIAASSSWATEAETLPDPLNELSSTEVSHVQ